MNKTNIARIKEPLLDREMIMYPLRKYVLSRQYEKDFYVFFFSHDVHVCIMPEG